MSQPVRVRPRGYSQAEREREREGDQEYPLGVTVREHDPSGLTRDTDRESGDSGLSRSLSTLHAGVHTGKKMKPTPEFIPLNPVAMVWEPSIGLQMSLFE